MEQRQRQHDTPTPQPNGGASDSNLDELSAAADRMLAAADRALERSLSGDSTAFLRANRQSGGQ